MPEKVVGTFAGQSLRWRPDEDAPFVDTPTGRQFVTGLGLTYSEVFSGIPELTSEDQIGALARWGAVYYLYKDGTWRANSTCGNWSTRLSE